MKMNKQIPPQPPQEKKTYKSQGWWLKPIILATLEAEIERIVVRGHLGKWLEDPKSTLRLAKGKM
jgi:hypothetical protein